jgi:hypothetical protein
MQPSTPPRSGQVPGPQGAVLTADNLPAVGTVRWSMRRKAELVAAVRGGLLSFDDVCARYAVTPEEYFAWRDGIVHGGVGALRVTRRRVP